MGEERSKRPNLGSVLIVNRVENPFQSMEDGITTAAERADALKLPKKYSWPVGNVMEKLSAEEERPAWDQATAMGISG